MKIIRVLGASIVGLIACVSAFPVAVGLCLWIVLVFLYETFDDAVKHATGHRLRGWWNGIRGDE